jgi:hypothetical protein
VFDLLRNAPCRVECIVARGSTPMAGVTITWEPADLSTGRVRRGDLLQTDSDGRATGQMAGGQAGSIVLRSAYQLVLGTREFPDGLPAGGALVERFDVAAGRIVVELPSGVAIPDRGALWVKLRGGTTEKPIHDQVIFGTPNHPVAGMRGGAWTTATVDLGDVAAGDYEISVHAMRSEPAPGGRPDEWMEVTFLTLDARPVRVEANATTRVELKMP